MGWFSKLTLFFAMLSLYASFVRRPVPVDVPDKQAERPNPVG